MNGRIVRSHSSRSVQPPLHQSQYEFIILSHAGRYQGAYGSRLVSAWAARLAVRMENRMECFMTKSG